MEDIQRREICKRLGLENAIKAHSIVLDGLKNGVQWLRGKRLDAEILTELGYDIHGMERIGYTKLQLREIGYIESNNVIKDTIKPEIEKRTPVTSIESYGQNDIRQLLKTGLNSQQLKQKGYTARHCKDAGLDVRDLLSRGFSLNELIRIYTLGQLKSARCSARDLRGMINESDLGKTFSAREMQSSGFSAKDLVRLNYPHNQIRTAGYSNRELTDAGLMTTTRKR